jgi:CBS domain-containing protein
MTREVITVTPETPLSEAEELMLARGIRRMPVMEHDHLIGIVTKGDLREADPSSVTSLSSWEVNEIRAKVKLGQLMTAKPKTISQDATINEAAQTMLKSKVSGLPVVDQAGKLVGIITESDIFRMVVQQWEQM